MSIRPWQDPVPRTVFAVAGMLSVPLLVWMLAWHLGGWIPQGDQAIGAMKMRDVFSAHPPLLGMRSTSSASVPDAHAHHPGPLQFYLQAVPYALTGFRPFGLLLGGAVLGFCFIAVAVKEGWRVARRRGIAVAVCSVLGVEFGMGATVVLPWNVYPPMLALVAMLMCAWRLMRGGSRALPWFVATGSFVLQANLFYVPTVAPMVAVLAVVGLVRWHAWRGALWPMPGEASPYKGVALWRRPGVLAIVAGLVCWAPSIAELFVLHPNNAQEMGKLVAGTFSAHLALGVVGVVLAVAVLVGVAWWTARFERPSILVSALVPGVATLLGLGAALAAGGTQRMQYALMALGLPFFLVGVIVVMRVPRPITGGRQSISRAAPILVALVLALAAVAIAPNGLVETGTTHEERVNADTARRDVERVITAFDQQVFGDPPVEVLGGDANTSMSSVPAVMMALRARGSDVYTPRTWVNEEDDEQRDSAHAPLKRVVLQVFHNRPPKIGIPWDWPAVKVK